MGASLSATKCCVICCRKVSLIVLAAILMWWSWLVSFVEGIHSVSVRGCSRLPFLCNALLRESRMSPSHLYKIVPCFLILHAHFRWCCKELVKLLRIQRDVTRFLISSLPTFRFDSTTNSLTNLVNTPCTGRSKLSSANKCYPTKIEVRSIANAEISCWVVILIAYADCLRELIKVDKSDVHCPGRS